MARNDLIQLQAKAARAYGVPWNEFDYLTLSELASIANDEHEEWLGRQLAMDNMLATVACCIYKAAGAKHVRPEQFLPPYQKQPKQVNKAASTQQTPEQIKQALSLLK